MGFGVVREFEGLGGVGVCANGGVHAAPPRMLGAGAQYVADMNGGNPAPQSDMLETDAQRVQDKAEWESKLDEPLVDQEGSVPF